MPFPDIVPLPSDPFRCSDAGGGRPSEPFEPKDPQAKGVVERLPRLV